MNTNNQQQEKVDHSPLLPLEISPYKPAYIGWDFAHPEKTTFFAMAYGDNQEQAAANAQFIVKACNNYEKMVDIVRQLTECLSASNDYLKHSGNGVTYHSFGEESISKAKQLLKDLEENQ